MTSFLSLHTSIWRGGGIALLVGLCLLFVACDSGGGSDDTVSVDGTLVNSTERGVRNAAVEFRRDGSVVTSAQTDETGAYSVRLATGDYDVRASASGYNPLDFTAAVSGDQTLDPQQLLGEANVNGTVINAQNGTAVEGAEVEFTFADGASSPQAFQPRSAHTDSAPDLVTTTDANGVYGILQAPTGQFICVIRAPGFITEVIDVGFQPGPNDFAPTSTSESLTDGQMRVVLEWGESPTDLDSHLTGPDGNGSRFHLYYANDEPANANANLDLDDVTSFGPETVTIDATRAGTYRYSVHNFSNQSENGALGIEQSPARVRVFDDTGLIRTYDPPTASSTAGNTWRVFEFDGDTRTISDDSGNTLGYFSASDDDDLTTFSTPSNDAKPTLRRSPFDQPVRR